MKRLMIAALCALPLGCTTPSSGIGLWELTKETAERYNEYRKWVQADLAVEQFPEGLCLSSISMNLTLSDAKNVGGNVGIPLAAPHISLSGQLGFGASKAETSTDGIVVPFVPSYMSAVDEKVAKKEWKDFLELWKDERNREVVKDLPDLPTGYDDQSDADRKAFDKRRDLAAELWRIREALHYVVRASGRNTDHFLVPGAMSFTRSFQVVRTKTGSATIAIAGRGTGDLNASKTVTSGNTMVLSFVKNNSHDNLRCDSTSLPKPEAKMDDKK